MTTMDVIGAVELTAVAAILVAVVSGVMGATVAGRVRIAAILGAWFILVVIMAAAGTLRSARTPLGMGLAVFAPVVLMVVALVRVRPLREALDRAPLAVLTAVHVVRLLGVSFLLLWGAGRLPAPFAPAAGWGDIAVGLLAIPVAWMAHRCAAGWRSALLAWNLVGLVDLVTAVTLGMLSLPGRLQVFAAEPGAGIMATLPWMLIPAFLVPLLMATHLAIFYRLAREWGVRASAVAA
jgi:hypothetical protein